MNAPMNVIVSLNTPADDLKVQYIIHNVIHTKIIPLKPLWWSLSLVTH